ncbi:S-layer homology domain-containing protein [Deinococcus sonorensis]|uniref:S-layer homology domain-containing protein n=2 Tax=Deinococcus sonorensis TaxID=309891 RepID=A0AAU7UBP2_9DEIO
MQNFKRLTIASTLALAIGAASAQTDTTAAPATSTQVTTFTDVPAGHWAKDAVDLIVQRGLIQGFPDGTFRGNDNLTRYQAALIFYRLLQSGNLSNGSVSSTDMTTIANGMQEVSTELAALTTRVSDLEKLTADQQTRIAALEQQIATLNTGSTANADVTALTARIDALETAVQNIPAGAQGPAGPAGAAADTSALEARVSALEAAANAAPATTTPATTPADTSTTPGTVVIGDTSTTDTTVATNPGRLYVGANYTYALATDTTNSTGVAVQGARAAYGVVVGSTQVVGPFGARIAADYVAGSNATNGGTINADADITYSLNAGGKFSPYVGVGFGLTSSKDRTAGSTTNVVDYSANGLVGVDYRFTNNIGVYAEAQGRFYLTNKGSGTNLQPSDPNATGFFNKGGFGSTAKAGLKFFF